MATHSRARHEQQEPKYEHLTREGNPDRRFMGQRHLPPPEEKNIEFQKPRIGGTLDDGTHITLIGKPDRRFKENRGKTDEEIMSEWAATVSNQYGNGAPRSKKH